MAGVAGVEPTSAVLETVILPLNYTPMTLVHSSTHPSGMQTKKGKIYHLPFRILLSHTNKLNDSI